MKYELGIIIGSNIPETEHKAIEQEILGWLDKIKAQTDKKFDSIGRKKLAYAIKKQKHGFYIFLNFELEDASKLKELDTNLKHKNKILRYLIIKKDRVAKTKTVGTKATPIKPVPVKAKEAKPEAKADWDDLDKRLDAILDEKID